MQSNNLENALRLSRWMFHTGRMPKLTVFDPDLHWSYTETVSPQRSDMQNLQKFS